jgi:hypothetical protein
VHERDAIRAAIVQRLARRPLSFLWPPAAAQASLA